MTAVVREFNDAELHQWVEDGKTQTWIAKQVGRTQQAISKRCARMGLTPSQPNKSHKVQPVVLSDEPEEVVEGEFVDEPVAGQGEPGDSGPETSTDDKYTYCPMCGHRVRKDLPLNPRRE
jgi:hypothetical protein